MNVKAPISTMMSTDLFTVDPEDKVQKVKDLMDMNEIHHIPVVKENKLVGLISRTDLLYFLKGMNYDSYQDIMNDVRLKNYKAEEIMTEELSCLKATDEIEKALAHFHKNRFHAIPIVDDDDALLGIITTFDIINAIVEEKAST